MSFAIKKGATAPALEVTLNEATAEDMAAATLFQIRWRHVTSGTVSTKTATLHSSVTKKVRYYWQTADTATAGKYQAEILMTKADGTVEIHPSIEGADAFFSFSITESLA